MGDEIWIYYAEANSSHPTAKDPRSQIRAAAWRKDGFASLATTGDTPGVLTTPALAFNGDNLEVNVDVEPGGEVRVALLNANSVALDGFDASHCDPIDAASDGVARTVSWHGKSELSSLRNTPLRLRITLKKARLYAFRIGAAGFRGITLQRSVRASRPTRIVVRLALEPVAETVIVNRDPQTSALDRRGFSTFLSRELIDMLPDDPEEFVRVLRDMAPPGAIIRIDGFAGGPMPPKAQILSVRIPRLDAYPAQELPGPRLARVVAPVWGRVIGHMFLLAGWWAGAGPRRSPGWRGRGAGKA
jgi:hypothetical protein